MSAYVPVTDQSQKPSDLQSCLDGKPRSAKKGLVPKYTLLKMKNEMKTNQNKSPVLDFLLKQPTSTTYTNPTDNNNSSCT